MKTGLFRKIRIALIAILAVAIVVVLVLWMNGKKAYEDKMLNAASNVTVVESPEQDAAMEHEAFIIEEYIPIVPEGTNIAEEGKIEASAYYDVYVPRKAIDGNLNGQSYWEAPADTYPNTLTITYEEPYEVHAVKVGLCPKTIWGKRNQEFSVEVTEDGENYTELVAMTSYEFTPDRNNEIVLEFDSVNIQGIRLTFQSNTGAGGAQVAEFEVYSNQVTTDSTEESTEE